MGLTGGIKQIPETVNLDIAIKAFALGEGLYFIALVIYLSVFEIRLYLHCKVSAFAFCSLKFIPSNYRYIFVLIFITG